MRNSCQCRWRLLSSARTLQLHEQMKVIGHHAVMIEPQAKALLVTQRPQEAAPGTGSVSEGGGDISEGGGDSEDRQCERGRDSEDRQCQRGQ